MKCKICGKEFESNYKHQIYCSRNCYRQNGNSLKRQKPILKICKICGKEFESSRPNKCYCSTECYNKRKLKKIIKKTCVICGKEFETSRNYQVTCNDKKCKLERRRQINLQNFKKKYVPKVVKKICATCGKEFTAADKHQQRQKYCCKACAPYRHKSAAELNEKRTCPICGKEFLPNNGNRIYCSSECHYRKNHPLRGKKLILKICATCGKEFKTTSHLQKYCSSECQKKPQEKRAVKKLYDRTCKFCHQEFKTTITNQYFCSESCKAAFYEEKKLKKEALKSYNKKTAKTNPNKSTSTETKFELTPAQKAQMERLKHELFLRRKLRELEQEEANSYDDYPNYTSPLPTEIY